MRGGDWGGESLEEVLGRGRGATGSSSGGRGRGRGDAMRGRGPPMGGVPAASGSMHPQHHAITSQDERPVILNPTGKYNMNFIDWENEWENAIDAMDNYEENPIPGMLQEDFESLIGVEFEEEIKANGVGDAGYKAIKTVKVYKNPNGTQCAICLKAFINGDKLKILPCKHKFHDNCLQPWLVKEHKCPLCRYDLIQKAYS